MSKTSRRRFLQTAGTTAAVGVVTGLTSAVSEAKPRPKLVSGTSHKGNLQEALDKAIGEAFAQGPQHPDVMLTYELQSIKGRVGGIAGFNEVTVTIKAQF